MKTQQVYQTCFLFGAQVFGLGIGFVCNLFLARQLGPQAFGVYAFALATLSFLAIFFEFGFFASGARMLAHTDDRQRRSELVGALLCIAAGIALAFVAVLLTVSLFIDRFFDDKIGRILQLTALASFALVLPFLTDLMLRGCNRINLLALFQVVSRAGFFLLVVLLVQFGRLSAVSALFALSTATLGAFLLVVVRLQPSWANLRAHGRDIWEENARFGWKNYTGRVIGSSSFSLDKLLLSFFNGAREVGYYSLAFGMANPVSLFANSLSGSLFKEFANHQGISRKASLVNGVSIVAGAVGASLLGWGVVHYYLGEDYRQVLPLLLLLVAAVAFQGGYQIHNSWLASNGYGDEMLLLAKVFTAVNLLGNLTLIPLYGAAGAAFATLAANVYYFIHCYWIYRLKVAGCAPQAGGARREGSCR